MAIELSVYGFIIGFLYFRINPKDTKSVYISLASAMITGRLAWGISKTILMGLNGKAFTVSMFIGDGFIDAIQG